MVYTIEEIKEKIKPVLEKYDIPKVYLFGSYARGEADEESDIDLSINSDNTKITGLFEEMEAIKDFEKVLNKSVDLVEEEVALKPTKYSTFYKEYAKERKVIYERGVKK